MDCWSSAPAAGCGGAHVNIVLLSMLSVHAEPVLAQAGSATAGMPMSGASVLHHSEAAPTQQTPSDPASLQGPVCWRPSVRLSTQPPGIATAATEPFQATVDSQSGLPGNGAMVPMLSQATTGQENTRSSESRDGARAVDPTTVAIQSHHVVINPDGGEEAALVNESCGNSITGASRLMRHDDDTQVLPAPGDDPVLEGALRRPSMDIRIADRSTCADAERQEMTHHDLMPRQLCVPPVYDACVDTVCPRQGKLSVLVLLLVV